MENSIANIWNAKLDNKGRTNRYIVKNNQYNQDIEVGEDVTFGILVNEPFQQFPTDYTMIGNSQIIEEDDYSVEYIVNEDWGSGFQLLLLFVINLTMILKIGLFEVNLKMKLLIFGMPKLENMRRVIILFRGQIIPKT